LIKLEGETRDCIEAIEIGTAASRVILSFLKRSGKFPWTTVKSIIIEEDNIETIKEIFSLFET
jgi:hypothetical protein